MSFLPTFYKRQQTDGTRTIRLETCKLLFQNTKPGKNEAIIQEIFNDKDKLLTSLH